jgi:branched-chain amino acid transport system substrate-binding protein
MTKAKRFVAVAAAFGLLAAACGSDKNSGSSGTTTKPATDASTSSAPGSTAASSTPPASSGTIKIGATLPLTGPLGAFGPLMHLGYDKAVKEVNDAGGLKVGDKTYTVELVVRDNKSDGNEAAAQARDLVLGDHVVALLGAVTPPLTIPISVVAEQNKVPLVSTVTPIRAWLGANAEGWKYSFDMFFDELQMTDLQFQASDLVQTNKKIALFTDLEEDGKVMGGLWNDKASKLGYEIVSHPEFPVGTTNFSSQVAEAKSKGAEIVIAQVIPPDAIAMLKEMKAQSYQPKVMFVEKGSNTSSWPAASEGLGEGVMAASWWAAGTGYPREQEFIDEFTSQTNGANSDLGGVVFLYSTAKVLLDAISKAGSTDAAAIVSALEGIDADYPAGHIKFAADHSAGMPAIMTQWRGHDMVYVTKADGTAGPEKIVSPVAGLG